MSFVHSILKTATLLIPKHTDEILSQFGVLVFKIMKIINKKWTDLDNSTENVFKNFKFEKLMQIVCIWKIKKGSNFLKPLLSLVEKMGVEPTTS